MTAPAAIPQGRPIAIPVADTLPWLIGAAVFGLLLYYFIGLDEGATSVFGNSMVVQRPSPTTATDNALFHIRSGCVLSLRLGPGQRLDCSRSRGQRS